jgi:Tic22-like family
MILHLLAFSYVVTLSRAFSIQRLPSFHLTQSKICTISQNIPRKPTSIIVRSSNNYGGDDENKGLSLKVLVIGFVGIVGLYGTDVFSTFNQAATTVKTFSSSQQQPGKPGQMSNLKEGNQNRGAMTRLTRREINEKLQQVPVFFATPKSSNKAIFVEGGTGLIFTTKEEADSYIAGKPDLEVSATSLDDVFFTLVQKKTKMGKFVDGVAGKSDATAEYRLKPSAKQVALTSDAWRSSHSENDIPLFRVANLAFSKKEGLEIPLFFRREDALNAFSRLQESKKEQAGSGGSISLSSAEEKSADVQVTSLLDLITLFNTGGFEGRALEIYPSMESMEQASILIEKGSTL